MDSGFQKESIISTDKPVQKRLLMPIVAALICFLILLALAFSLVQQQTLRDNSLQQLSELDTEIQHVIEQQTQALLALEQTVIRDLSLQKALKEKNRELILQELQPLYQTLNQELRVTHFYFHDEHLINLVRLHQPNRFSDRIERFTARSALESGRPASGLELGVLGTLTLRVVSPVYQDGSLLGFIELGTEIEDLLQESEVDNVWQWALFIDKSRLQQQTWQEGMRWMQRNDNWNRFEEVVLASNSINSFSSDWLKAINKLIDSGEQFAELPLKGGKQWHLGVVPIMDVAEHQVGKLFIFLDQTEQRNNLLHSAFWASVSLCFVVVVMIIYFYFALRKVDINLKQQQLALEKLALNDVLTGLPNRQLFQDRLSHSLRLAHRKQSQLAVLFLDLDNFKNINDSYGHAIGDELLIAVAKRLKSCLREGDTLARNGGDEFVLLLEDLPQPESASMVANHLIQSLRKPLQLENQQISSSVSIGISLYPQDGETIELLMRNADAAMYNAKAQGRNQFTYYTEDFTQNALKRVTLEEDLRNALIRDELFLCYQPQYDIESSKIIGLEALARWYQPEHGYISPAEFIPIAEQSGLIGELGYWALLTACKQAKHWQEKGIEFGRISVNVAATQLQKGNFSDSVMKALEETGLAPSYLELEVTESSLMQNVAQAEQQLSLLRDQGITIAIDDFGTGYSSLAYLKSLPIHRIKIDKSFIADVPDDSDDVAIVESVIAMAKSLNLQLIAEGVENEKQLTFLLQRNCTAVQGYYFSKPENALVIEQRLRDDHTS